PGEEKLGVWITAGECPALSQRKFPPRLLKRSRTVRLSDQAHYPGGVPIDRTASPVPELVFDSDFGFHGSHPNVTLRQPNFSLDVYVRTSEVGYSPKTYLNARSKFRAHLDYRYMTI